MEPRAKRSTKHFFVGRVRGQTQSQYLNFGNSKEPGKAEAESSYGSSKAVVSKYITIIDTELCKNNLQLEPKQFYILL